MEKENLSETAGAEKKETLPKFKKTGRKYVSNQKQLCSFSIFVRVLIVIIWFSAILPFALQGSLAYQMATTAFAYGIIAALLWFTVGDIHTAKEVEWEEYVETETDKSTAL